MIFNIFELLAYALTLVSLESDLVKLQNLSVEEYKEASQLPPYCSNFAQTLINLIVEFRSLIDERLSIMKAQKLLTVFFFGVHLVVKVLKDG